MFVLKQLLSYLVCSLLSVTLSSYLLISSLVFTTAFVSSNISSGTIFEQVLEIPVKKNNNEFSCGYLKFIASNNLADKVLKTKAKQIPSDNFTCSLPENSKPAIFRNQHLIFSGYPPPDTCVLNCSFRI